MTRTALLPTPGDPFMLAYWLRNFETWRDEVDELVVFVNGAVPDPEALRRMVEAAGGRFHHVSYRVGHDGALRWLLEGGTGSHVVLCEDDAYVRKPGAVGEAFRRIETGEVDIVGSPRGEDYASSPLQVWPDRLTHEHEEVRRGLWPAFLFARRADLLATDRVYGDRSWMLDSVIGGLGMRVTPELCEFVGISPNYVHLDTLFGITFQLRAKEPRIDLVHRVRVYDAQAAEEWLGANPPWFHVTNLSTLGYVLQDVPITDIPDIAPDGGLWTRRVAWWLRSVPPDVPGAGERIAKLWEFAARTGMRRGDIEDWQRRFEPWVTWQEALVPA